ncbi:MAG TPA: CHASE2 domain-containing protein, partial [bacterium]|nr:CHASE2 domain-containing protein [bacterium]
MNKLKTAIVFFMFVSACQLFAVDSLTYVRITAPEIESMGGWPMARKWYGTMINHLRAHGAQQIFVDISFLHADALHPESDAFFYSVVSRESDVYFLNADTSADTFSFLGIHRLPKAHSFGLFSDFFEISADRMIYHPSQRSLTSILAGPSGPERSV